MAGIDLTISLWGRERRVVVSALMGGNYHLYIDKFFQGQIIKRQGKYECLYTTGCDLPGDDIQGLLDVLQDGAETEKPPGALI